MRKFTLLCTGDGLARSADPMDHGYRFEVVQAVARIDSARKARKEAELRRALAPIGLEYLDACMASCRTNDDLGNATSSVQFRRRQLARLTAQSPQWQVDEAKLALREAEDRRRQARNARARARRLVEVTMHRYWAVDPNAFLPHQSDREKLQWEVRATNRLRGAGRNRRTGS